MIDDVVNITQTLMKFKTVENRYKEIMKAVDFINKYAAQNGLYFEKIDNGNHPIILVSNGCKRKFDIISLGHIDVVPASNESQYTPKIDGNLLKGRGSFDMKTGVAIGLELLRWVKKMNLDVNMGVVLTSDEETIGSKTMDLVEKKGIHSKIILDSDGLTGISTMVEKTKNAVFGKLVTKGKKVSSRIPWTGESAIDNLLQSLAGIRKHFPYYDRKHLPGTKMNKGDFWDNHLTIGTIDGGSSRYRVSADASAELDFRLVNGLTGKDVKRIIKPELVGNTKYEEIYEFGFINEDKNAPIIAMYANIIEKITGQKVKFVRDGRGSNSCMLKNKKGTTVIMHSYTGGNQHGPDEFVDLDTVKQQCLIQKEFIKKVIKSK